MVFASSMFVIWRWRTMLLVRRVMISAVYIRAAAMVDIVCGPCHHKVGGKSGLLDFSHGKMKEVVHGRALVFLCVPVMVRVLVMVHGASVLSITRSPICV
jgi:hypothetical protein